MEPASTSSPPTIDARTWLRAIARAVGVCGAGFLFTTLFWFRPAALWPVWGTVIRALSQAVSTTTGFSSTGTWALESWLLVVPAVVLVRVVSGRSTALGAGRVAHGGWRVLVFCFLVATPVLIWLGTRDSMHAYYARYVVRGGVMLWVCNGLVIVVEHAWIEGVLLALAVPPQVPFDDEEPVRTGRLAFLGFGLPAGARGFAAWIGIPALVWPALIAQALVFGLVHVGKTPEELLTAFPGGLGLGMLTWRMRSVWPSVLLHVGTGAIILVTILLSR